MIITPGSDPALVRIAEALEERNAIARNKAKSEMEDQLAGDLKYLREWILKCEPNLAAIAKHADEVLHKYKEFKSTTQE